MRIPQQRFAATLIRPAPSQSPGRADDSCYILAFTVGGGKETIALTRR